MKVFDIMYVLSLMAQKPVTSLSEMFERAIKDNDTTHIVRKCSLKHKGVTHVWPH